MPQPRRLLIVDDEDLVRRALGRNLTRAGFEVTAVASGEEALAHLEKNRPNLVLLDVMMPGEDGFEVLAKIRSNHSYDDLPVVMSTACDARADILNALRRGANDFASKPIRIPDLIATIEANLRRDEISTGDKIGSYVVIDKIGAGGAGAVYRCEEEITGRLVALKVLSHELTSDEEFVARFLREAKVAAQIRNDHVVGVYGAGRSGSTYYIGLELVDGDDLFNIASRGGVSEERALRITLDIARGLEELARHGIIHRDIKPENILVATDGRAKITDFGLARPVFTDDKITAQGMAVGTLPYIAPEQLLGKVDSRSDIYALGATLFFALTGRAPFSNDEPTTELVKKKFHTPPSAQEANPKVSTDATELTKWLMTPEASARPQSFGSVVSRIEAVLELSTTKAFVA